METSFAILDGSLEIRRSGGGRTLSGSFPYNQTATRRDRGRVRKESFNSNAFRFAIEQEPERRLDLLVGHSWDKPLASRQAGTLTVRNTPDAVTFEAVLPDDPPSWVLDAERAIDSRLMAGVSPGYTVPPLSVVPDAEELIPEPGNPGVSIRRVNQAVLRELSIVTAPVYVESTVELRDEVNDRRGRERQDGGRRLWL